MSKTGSKVIIGIDWFLFVGVAVLWILLLMFERVWFYGLSSTLVLGMKVVGGIGLAISLAFNILLTMGLNRESHPCFHVWIYGQGVFLILQAIAILVFTIANSLALSAIPILIYRVVAIYVVRTPSKPTPITHATNG